MAHPRKLIRHAVVAMLTNATSAGARVVATRLDPNKKTQLPAISVFTPGEPVDPNSSDTAPRELTRTVKVEIAGWVSGTDAVPVDDAMDDLAEQIEAAMDFDPQISGNAADSILENTDLGTVNNDPTVGIVVLTYAVMYRTEPGVVVLDDFLRAKATHQLVGGVVDTVSPVDEFIVQEITP